MDWGIKLYILDDFWWNFGTLLNFPPKQVYKDFIEGFSTPTINLI